MLPEIALTTQMIAEFAQYFNCPAECIIHGFHLSRGTLPKGIARGNFNCSWGALKCFSAFKDLGLVIVDEEHEVSYKQQDPSQDIKVETWH